MILESFAARDAVERMSDHFKWTEFACPCCDYIKIDERLIMAAENLRHECGFSITLASAYRCPKHNKEVGGAVHSRHLTTDAIDPKISKMDAHKIGILIQVANTEFPDVAKFNGFGMGAGKMHLDIRDEPAGWTYP